MPDAVGNLFHSEAKNDREYGPAGQLFAKHDKNGTTRYQYDAEGNLIGKVEPSGKVWRYEWNAAGFLRKVMRPDGREVKFEYDALGRRISKTYNGRTTRWVWDGNNPLHEWVESIKVSAPLKLIKPNKSVEAEIAADQREITLQPLQSQAPPAVAEGDEQNPATWLFDPDSFAPMGKMVDGRYYSIVTDYLGTPTAMFDDKGQKVWSADITVWGDLRNLEGERQTCPFRWPGQYDDEETGLYYNRFRYYDADAGQYVSQDPIGLLGSNKSFYAYVRNPNSWIDIFGLTEGQPKRIFENAPYHGTTDNAVKSRAPTNGQVALDSSVQVKPTSPRRVGVDVKNNELVVLDRTKINPDGVEVYHGHVRSWDDLHPDQQKALKKAGLVDKKGRIKGGCTG